MAPEFTLPLMLGSIPKPKSSTQGDSSAAGLCARASQAPASSTTVTNEKHTSPRRIPISSPLALIDVPSYPTLR